MKAMCARKERNYQPLQYCTVSHVTTGWLGECAPSFSDSEN